MLNSPASKVFLFSACLFMALAVGGAVLFLSPVLSQNIMFTAAVPFAALFVLVMFLDIKWMMLLLLYTRSLMDPALNMTKFGVAPGATGIGAVLNLLVIIIAILLVLRFPDSIKGHRTLLRNWVLFLLVCFVSIVFSPQKLKSVKLWMNFVTYLCIILIPLMVVKKPADKKFWVKTLFFSSFLPVGLAVFGAVTHHPSMYAFKRLAGTFTHANILSFYLVFVLVVDFYILKTEHFRLTLPKKCFLYAYLAVILSLLVVTQTRSAWIAVAFMFSIYSLLKERRALLVLLIGIPMMLAVPQVQTRLLDLKQGTGERKFGKLNSMYWRVQLWKSSLDLVKHRPVVGHGLGSFESYSADFFTLDKKHERTGGGTPAHNAYLELLFETGVVGLSAYLAIFFVILRRFWGQVKSKVPGVSTEATILFCYTIGYLTIGISDNTLYYLAFNWYFWFFIALILQSLTFHVPQAEAAEPSAS